VLDRETVEIDPSTGAATLRQPVRAAAGRVGDTAAVLLFTDEELADRYIRAKGLDGITFPLQSRVHVVDFLERQVPAGFTHAAFDSKPEDGSCRWNIAIQHLLRLEGPRDPKPKRQKEE
jgi:hypothetical protein